MSSPDTLPAPRLVIARFFDGHSARAQSARLWFLPGPELVVQADRLELRHAAKDIRLDSALGNTPRFLRLPGGQSCEITDLAALDAALAVWPASVRRSRGLQSWRGLTAVVVCLAILATLTLLYGLPLAARQVAFMLPPDTMAKISHDSLAELDATLFEPSRLPFARQDALRRRARVFLMAAGEPPDRRIEFRSAPTMGANAMALPSGVIVVTDDLVHLAQNDDQILAVLAHECGHVHYRHSLRGILQNSAVVMAVTLVAGKQHSADSLQASLTTELVNSRHSRDFEFEADAYGAELLTRAHMRVNLMGEILDRLEQQSGGSAHVESGLDSYLRSHPATKDRKQRLGL